MLFCLVGLTIIDRLPWKFTNGNRNMRVSKVGWSLVDLSSTLSITGKSHKTHLCYLTCWNLVTLEDLIDRLNINPSSINNRLAKVLEHLFVWRLGDLDRDVNSRSGRICSRPIGG